MTLAVDFDGVLHRYSQGWADGTIYDGPMPGAITGLRELMDYEAVFVHTSRDPHAVADWLIGYGVPAVADSPVSAREFWNERGLVLVTRRKYPATVYLDDRAVRFTGWDTAADDIARAVEAGTHPTRILDAIETAPRYELMPGCPHCPDGHTPPDHGQPWHVRVADDRDGDGQPVRLVVERAAGAHIAESDAAWLLDLITRATT